MRHLIGWMGLLWLVAGCTVPEVGELPGTCQSNADCTGGAMCDVSSGICYAQDVEEPAATCTPACAEYEACTRSGCRPRFTGLNIRKPSDNSAVSGGTNGGTVEVVAELVADPLYASTTQFPDSLSFSATQNGSAAGTFGAVARSGGVYTVPWTLPLTQGQVTLTAAHPDPDARLSNSVNVTVDSVSPAFNISFSSPPARAIGNVTVADQRDLTLGFDAAFRRDESVTVTVSADETVASFDMTVVGIGPGGGSGQTQTVTLQPSGTCGASAFCRTATVDLGTLEMSAFRGSMTFRVEGQDGAGNQSSATAMLPVTRWKWAYQGNGNIVGSPAVGAQGTVYVGTNLSTGTGTFFAINPDGTRKWEALVGDASGSPAVGAFVSGEEFVYTAARTGSGSFLLYALRGSDGTETTRCTYSNATEVPGSLAVGATPTGVGTTETGIAIYSGSPVRIVGIRPNDFLSDRCPEVSGTGPSAIPASGAGSSLVMKDQNIFYGTSVTSPGPRITSYEFGLNTPRSGFAQPTTFLTRGIAMSGDKLYAGAGSTDDPSLGSLFSIPTTGGAIAPILSSSRVFNLAIGTGDVAYFGAETATTADLLSLPLNTVASPTRVADVGTLRGAPVIAKNDRLYTVNAQGKVSAWVASTLAPLWNMDLQIDLSTKDTSPTLDCRRDAGGAGVQGATTGTLYFVGTTKLYAFIVDSPGLDTNAPWPKFQHDARNTGNPATPITNCP